MHVGSSHWLYCRLLLPWLGGMEELPSAHKLGNPMKPIIRKDIVRSLTFDDARGLVLVLEALIKLVPKGEKPMVSCQLFAIKGLASLVALSDADGIRLYMIELTYATNREVRAVG